MMAKNELIYLDNAATTKVDPLVLEAMLPYLEDGFANPSAGYGPAHKARHAVEEARKEVAELIGAEPDEVFFTSGGTESDQLALSGALAAIGGCAGRSGFVIVSDELEHPAVRNTLAHLEKTGQASLIKVKPESNGFIGASALSEVLEGRGFTSAGTCKNGIISIMTANNEIGTINDMDGIAGVAEQNGFLLHSDAVQALGHIPVDVSRIGFDLLSASAHKLGGPKGIGMLYIRRGTPFSSMSFGGGQERGIRSGTENVAGIVGFGRAAQLAGNRMEEDRVYVSGLRDRLISRICAEIPDTILTGPACFNEEEKDRRLPGSASFAFRGIQGSSLVIRLDMAGICASTGSACSASSGKNSHVLSGIGVSPEYIGGSLRITLSRGNTPDEIERAADIIAQSVADLRRLGNYH